MDSWQTFFDLSAEIGQTDPIVATEVCTNELIPAANDFDAAEVAADAEAAEISDEMAAVDVEAIRAAMFDQAIGS